VTASWGSLKEERKYCDTMGYTSEEGFAVSDPIVDIFVIASSLPLMSIFLFIPSISKQCLYLYRSGGFT